MPTYEYECASCGKRFDKFQKMSDEPVRTCPDCGQAARRLFGTGAGIIFKGAGFYATDYGTNSTRPARRTGGKTCCGRSEPCAQPPCGR